MVQRHGVHLDVIAVHPAVDDAGHVLPHQRAARQHRALGPGLGAGGVHQPHQVIVADIDLRWGALPVDPVLQVGPPGRHLIPAQPDHRAHRDLQPGRLDRLGGHGGQPVLGHERPRPAVAQDVGDLGRAEHEIDRHQDHAEPGGRERQYGELPAIVRQQRQPVALAQPLGRQGGRRPRHRRLQLSERQPGLATDDSQLARHPRRSPMQHLADALPPGQPH